MYTDSERKRTGLGIVEMFTRHLSKSFLLSVSFINCTTIPGHSAATANDSPLRWLQKVLFTNDGRWEIVLHSCTSFYPFWKKRQFLFLSLLSFPLHTVLNLWLSLRGVSAVQLFTSLEAVWHVWCFFSVCLSAPLGSWFKVACPLKAV